MATRQTTTTAKRRTSTAKGQARRTARQTRTTAKTTATASKGQVQRVAETAVDVPVGAVINAVERVQEIVDPWTSRNAAERELRSYRTQLTRGVNRAERKGATARRKAATQAKRTQRRTETTLRQNRRRLETTLRRNRRQAETQVRKATRRAEKAQSDLVGTVSDQVNSLV